MRAIRIVSDLVYTGVSSELEERQELQNAIHYFQKCEADALPRGSCETICAT